jgi:hypothetical protein
MSSYNGWTNYETWNVGLWFMDDMVSIASDNGKPVDYQWCKEIVEEHIDGLCFSASFAADVLNSFINSVDWHEIASHVNDAAELTEEEEEEGNE